jgi:hypothetical protein
VTHPYASASYAKALDFAGRPLALPEWSGFVMLRSIAATDDAMGVYPRQVLPADADLQGGLARLAVAGLVSLVLVPDPSFSPQRDDLARAFDVCRPFKTHQFIERAKGYAPSRNHRQKIRRAQSRCRVDRAPLAAHLADWRRLYDALSERHGISGVAGFPDAYFEVLARMPIFETFVAILGGAVVSMAIWFEHQGVAYYHLGASSPEGYAIGASYGLHDAAIQHFSGAARIDLGAGAGLIDDPQDGLARFKRGFANAEAQALICGAVLDRQRYEALTRGRQANDFFPAYRAGVQPAGGDDLSNRSAANAMASTSVVTEPFSTRRLTPSVVKPRLS